MHVFKKLSKVKGKLINWDKCLQLKIQKDGKYPYYMKKISLNICHENEAPYKCSQRQFFRKKVQMSFRERKYKCLSDVQPQMFNLKCIKRIVD